MRTINNERLLVCDREQKNFVNRRERKFVNYVIKNKKILNLKKLKRV